LIGGLPQEVAVLGHVHPGQGVEAQVDAMFRAHGLDGLTACVVKKFDCVGAVIELNIDKIHVIFSGPRDSVFQLRAAADVNANAILEGIGHAVVPEAGEYLMFGYPPGFGMQFDNSSTKFINSDIE